MLSLVRPDVAPVAAGTEPAEFRGPWAEIARMHQAMDDLFSRAFGYTPLSRMAGEWTASARPPVELYETDEAYTLRAHLPGMSREDIHLEVTGRRVSLRGERRAALPSESARVHVNTAGQGRFQLQYELPLEIIPDQVTATYADGVLEATLPKVPAARTHAVSVAIAGR